MLSWAEILACWTSKRSNRVHTGEVRIIGERCGLAIPGWVEWEGLSKADAPPLLLRITTCNRGFIHWRPLKTMYISGPGMGYLNCLPVAAPQDSSLSSSAPRLIPHAVAFPCPSLSLTSLSNTGMICEYHSCADL